MFCSGLPMYRTVPIYYFNFYNLLFTPFLYFSSFLFNIFHQDNVNVKPLKRFNEEARMQSGDKTPVIKTMEDFQKIETYTWPEEMKVTIRNDGTTTEMMETIKMVIKENLNSWKTSIKQKRKSGQKKWKLLVEMKPKRKDIHTKIKAWMENDRNRNKILGIKTIEDFQKIKIETWPEVMKVTRRNEAATSETMKTTTQKSRPGWMY